MRLLPTYVSMACRGLDDLSVSALPDARCMVVALPRYGLHDGLHTSFGFAARWGGASHERRRRHTFQSLLHASSTARLVGSQ